MNLSFELHENVRRRQYTMDASSPREGATHTVADPLQIPTQGELSNEDSLHLAGAI